MRFKDSILTVKRSLFSSDMRFHHLLSFAFVLVYQQMTYYDLETESVVKLINSLDSKTRNPMLLRNIVSKLGCHVKDLETAVVGELRENWIDHYQLDILLMKYRIIPLLFKELDESNMELTFKILILQLSKLSSLLQTSFKSLAMNYKDYSHLLNSKNELSMNFLTVDSSLEHLHFGGLYDKPISLREFINQITQNCVEIIRHNDSLMYKFINEIESSLECFFELSNFVENSRSLNKSIQTIEDFRTNVEQTIASCLFLSVKLEAVAKYKEFNHISQDLFSKTIKLHLLIKNLVLVSKLINTNTKCNKRYHLLIESMCISTLNYIKSCHPSILSN